MASGEDTPRRIVSPAEIVALVRAANERGFAARRFGVASDATGFRSGGVSGLARAVVAAPGPALPPVAEDAGRAGAHPPGLHGDHAIRTVPVPPPAPTAAEISARVEAARAEGHAAGLEEGHALGHAAGVAEGRAAALAEAEARAQAEIAALRRRLEQLIEGLNRPLAAESARLAAVIEDAVFRLAGDRAGQAITDRPAAFLRRIEALAERVSAGVRQVEVRLNPDDLAAIAPLVSTSEALAQGTLVADARLARGAVDLRAEGVRLADLLEPEAAMPGTPA